MRSLLKLLRLRLIDKRGITLKVLTKSVTAILVTIILLISVSSEAAAITDNGAWEDSKLCLILEANGESNSDLCFAAVKVKYDRSINRIYLLFLLEYKNMNDDKLSGVVMNFNNMGNIKILSDGTAEYDENVYYAELVDEIYDRYSKNIMLETSVGIKDGIPEKVVMKVNIFDTNGVKSNLYTVDITEEQDDEISVQQADEPTEKATKRVKTTKHKTTKEKITKLKTTKSQKTKSDGDEESVTQTEIDSGIRTEIGVADTRKKAVTVFGATAAVVAIAAGCAAGIRVKKKDKK